MSNFKNIFFSKKKSISIGGPTHAKREQLIPTLNSDNKYELPETDIDDLVRSSGVTKDAALRSTTDVFRRLHQKFESTNIAPELPTRWSLRYKLNKFSDISLTPPTEMYTLSRKICEGDFGNVEYHQAFENKHNSKVMIQILRNVGEKEIKNRIGAHKLSKHSNVIRYIGTHVVEKDFQTQYWLVTEYLNCGTLFDLIQKTHNSDFKLDEKQIGYILTCALKALKAVHAQFHIHRDVKSDNFRVDSTGRIKLTNFKVSAGLSKEMHFRRSLVGTPYWMAPELIMANNYNHKVDIWSLGIVLLEVCDRYPPLLRDKVSPLKALYLISQSSPPSLLEPSKWSDDLTYCVKKMLKRKPNRRPEASKILAYDFIQKRCEEEEFSDFLHLVYNLDKRKRKKRVKKKTTNNDVKLSMNEEDISNLLTISKT